MSLGAKEARQGPSPKDIAYLFAPDNCNRRAAILSECPEGQGRGLDVFESKMGKSKKQTKESSNETQVTARYFNEKLCRYESTDGVTKLRPEFDAIASGLELVNSKCDPAFYQVEKALGMTLPLIFNK